MITNNGPIIISVSQLNYYIKSLIESDDKLRYVFVTGEISNLTDHYASGHIYLSLKDSKAVVKAVMFSFSAKNLKFRPQNGMKVIARGRISVYEPSGQYQLYIEDMQPDGVGSLAIAYEQLKAKLQEEGLFNPEHKKPLPHYPKKITVITSPTGAALQDIRNVLTRRWPYSAVEIIPVLVQGDGAAPMLAEAIKQADSRKDSDVIIIGRGGGSIEDLWAFNSEALARAIFDCSIPVISAVGHETDFTICDFVSDMRAPTPSAAAELATPDRFGEIDMLLKQRQYLVALGENFISAREKVLSECYSVLTEKDPRKDFNTLNQEFMSLSQRLLQASENRFKEHKNTLENLKTRLFALDPVSILNRGYSVVSLNGKTVTSSKELSKEDKIKIRFKDGEVSAVVD
ncbi:MAG: exodeoxyribonuclease VII large subunit [Ruminococcus sp.]|nr:exodeoxyribonuclease VII large subunit [Ruminococcus sp.]